MKEYEEKEEAIEKSKNYDNSNFKEFYNLSGFYLKLSHIQNELEIIIYDIEELDGVKYELKINLNEIYHLDNIFKGYSTIQEIYKLIIKLINENNYSLKKLEKEKNKVIFLLKMKDILNNIKEIQFVMAERKDIVNINNNEYINILINEIKQMRKNNKLMDELKEENKYIKNELNKLKKRMNIKDFIPLEDFKTLIINNNNIIELELYNKN